MTAPGPNGACKTDRRWRRARCKRRASRKIAAAGSNAQACVGHSGIRSDMQGGRTRGWLRCRMMRTGRWRASWLMLAAVTAMTGAAVNTTGVAVAAEPETLAISATAPVVLGAGPVTVTLA